MVAGLVGIGLSVWGHGPLCTLEFALRAWRTEPELGVRDAYKWLYQASLGGEHAATSERHARRWLLLEWAGLGAPIAGEPLALPLRADRSLVRVNLRPYKALKGVPGLLLEAFVGSAREFRPGRRSFEAVWALLGEALREGPAGGIDRSGWERLDAEAREGGYPPMEHSAEYSAARNPSYRVVTGAWLGRVLGPGLSP